MPTTNEFRSLSTEKLIETADRVAARLQRHFPEAHLAQVGFAAVAVLREARTRAEKIRRPDWWLRGGLLGLGALILAAAVLVGIQLQTQATLLHRIADYLRYASGTGVYLVAVVVFLVTLETRLKRRRAVQAIHELRALAHIIDMHQLAKDPEAVVAPGEAVLPEGKRMTVAAMALYLNYCTELLALISKAGQLYIQDFPDATALAAADQFENLATGLSQKIWQKLMILDRVRADMSALEPAK